MRIINEVKTGLAPYGASYNGGNKGIIDSQNDVGGWPVLESVPAPADSDHDGMPDDWEISHSLSPYDSSDARQIDTSGYTMLEVYINGLIRGNVTSVENNKQIPSDFSLKQNYPNPFNPTTKIEYAIPVTSNVTLEVFDVLGRKIRTLIDKVQSAGNHEIIFDGSDLTSGIYIYTLLSPGQVLAKKMTLIK